MGTRIIPFCTLHHPLHPPAELLHHFLSEVDVKGFNPGVGWGWVAEEKS